MRKGWKIAAIVAMVAILGMATVAVVAYAQDATTGPSPIWDLGQKVKEAVAAALGISVEKYDETVTTAQKQVLDEAVAAGQLTQTQADEMLKHLEEFPGMGFMGRGMGHGRGDEGLLLTVAADKLGMTEAELRTALEGGKSIADVAKEKGVDTQAITDAFLAQLKTKLDAQVADGSITQAQADERLQQETQNLPSRLSQTWGAFGMGHGRGGPRGGGHWGPPPDETPDSSGQDTQ